MKPLHYTGGHLDRVATQRKSSEWTSAQLRNPTSILIPLWRGQNLINIALDPRCPTAEFCRRDVCSDLVEHASHSILLGTDQDRAFFALDISTFEEREAVDLCKSGQFVDLRTVGPIMRHHEAALMAYARGMVYWHRNHLFCGVCGHPTSPHEGGHMRRCENDVCGRRTFPRTDPAVIMLVERPVDGNTPAKCLLGRHAGLPAGMYSTLAGFVEPGETLEEAVAREVREETGIRTERVIYQQSQPWPFPASIMLGFRARALDTKICIDPDELEDAAWFSANEVREFREWGEDSADKRLPRKDSIARFLIDSWVDQVLP